MKWASIPIVLALAAVLAWSSAFTVYEGQQVIVTEFGKPIGEPITEAGLHFKTPFTQEARYFEKRILEWDGDPNQIPTRDKKFIHIDTTARWRIKDPLRFLEDVNNVTRAQTLLDDILDAETRDAISSLKLVEAVRSSGRAMAAEEDAGNEGGRAGHEKISVGRREIAQKIFTRAKGQVEQYGIELIDFRIKAINYVKKVREDVYKRMISERNKIAEQYRSEGKGKAAEIDGQRQKELLGIRSEAYKKAEQIRGDAEAQATTIYAEAYSADPEFFSFIETLNAYPLTFDKDTLLILSTDSTFMKYLKDSK